MSEVKTQPQFTKNQQILNHASESTSQDELAQHKFSQKEGAQGIVLNQPSDRTYTLVDIKNQNQGMSSKRPNTRSNERKSRQPGSQKSAGQNQNNSMVANSNIPNTKNSQESSLASTGIQRQHSLNERQSSINHTDDGLPPHIQLMSEDPLSAPNALQHMNDMKEWNANQLIAEGNQSFQMGILATSGEAQHIRGGHGNRQRISGQPYADKTNSNLRKRTQNNSNHRGNEPKSAKNQKIQGHQMIDQLQTPILGQGLSQTRGPSHTGYPMGGVPSSGLHSAPPTNDAYGDAAFQQNMNLENGFQQVNFNTNAQQIQGNQKMNHPQGQQDYPGAALNYMQQQQPQLPSTFAFTQSANSAQNFQQQQNNRPVHFIANTQKFYGISPERAQQLLFNTGANNQGIMASSDAVGHIGSSGEKRPFTTQQLGFMNAQLPTSASAGPNSTVFNKRTSNAAKAAQQHQMIAQLYLGGSAPNHKNNNYMQQNSEPQAPRSQNVIFADLDVPAQNNHAATHYGGFNIREGNNNKKINSRLAGIMGTYGQTAGIQGYSQSVPRKPGTSGGISAHGNTTQKRIIREQEQLYEEVMRFKQQSNQQREENIKLKTKIKVLENDMLRKERTLEDFFQQQQFIAQAQQKNNFADSLLGDQKKGNGQTAQRYQQETFLVMSLKKQIKELKSDLVRRDEEIALNKRNVRHTKFYEMETEIKIYRDELARLRFILEQQINTNNVPDQGKYLNLNDNSNSTATNELKNNSALSNHKVQVKQGGELKNSFSEPPTGKNIQSLSDMSAAQTAGDISRKIPDRLEVMIGNELSDLSEQVQVSNQNTVAQDPTKKANSGLNKQNNQYQQNERLRKEVEQKNKELQRQLSSFQKENNELQERSKSHTKELQRTKKMLKDKEVEVKKLKTDLTSAQENKQKSAEESKDDAQKQKQLQQKLNEQNKKTLDMKNELKTKQDQIEKLNKDVKSVTEKQKTQADKIKKEQISAVKSLEAVIEELKGQLKTKDEEKKALLEQKTVDQSQSQEGLSKQTKIKELLAESLDQLSLIAEQICFKSKTDRVECAEIIFMAVNDENDKTINTEGSYEGLNLFLEKSIKELVQMVSIQELACILPKCRSNTLTNDDKEQLLKDLRKQIPSEAVDHILKSEDKKDTMVTFEELKDVIILEDTQEDKKEGELTQETAYRLIQILYFENYSKGVPKFNVMKLAMDLKKSQIRGISNLEKSVILGKDEARTPDLMSSAETLSSRFDGRRRSSVDDERMLDVAEGCFIRLSELLIEQGRTVRGIFTKFSQPEVFPDNTVLELLSPMSFLAGVRETGFIDLQEVEAACLMKVLSKPELENHIILNELVLIMENFGVSDNLEDDEEDDFIPDSSSEQGDKDEKTDKPAEETKDKEETKKGDHDRLTAKKNVNKKLSKSKMVDVNKVDTKGQKILTKLACFLLKQFVHPREFFGQAIKKQAIQTKSKMYKIDTLTFKEFYLRMKIASIRKKLTPNASLNKELCVDSKKYEDVIHVKSLVRILEEIAEAEQERLMKEQEEKEQAKTPSNLNNIAHEFDAESVVTPKTNDSASGQKPKEDLTEGRPTGFRNNPISKSQDVEDAAGKGKKLTRTEPSSPKESGDYKEGDLMKFGSAKLEGSFSTSRGKSTVGPKVELCTIEEDKAETQTSHYMDGISERQDSSLQGGMPFRGSNVFHDSDAPESEKKPKCRSFSNMSGSDTEKDSPAIQSMKFNNSSGKSDKQKAKQIQEKLDASLMASNFNLDENHKDSKQEVEPEIKEEI